MPNNAHKLRDKWSKLSDQDWVAVHVPRFKQVRPRYQDYERFLEEVLKAACKKSAPLAIVNARAKSVPSFADKILRKHKLYVDRKNPQPPDPLVRMTDLCGGRVIVHSQQQVKQVGDFIKEAFDIDWANSEDASQRLKPTEFGYRSVHYIVTANPQKLRAAGITVPIPRRIKGLKAEIQVRTLLEHASADIGHDTLYKAGMKVSDPVRRQFAALAAVLEGADHEFGRLLTSLEDLKSSFGTWHKLDEVKQEIERLLIVLKCEPGNEELGVKIGHLALAIGEHQAALNVLKPFQSSQNQAVQRVRGLALTEMNWNQPFGRAFQKGIEFLEAVCSRTQVDAETLCALAECRAHRGDDIQAGDLFRRGIVVDSTEPLSFCRFLEFEVARQRNDAVVRLTEPMIQRTMDRCRNEIQAGVNLPIAWSCLAVFQLLLRQPFAALHSLAQVLVLCGKPTEGIVAPAQPCAAGRVLRRTRETVQHLSSIREKIEGFDWFERMLLLSLATLVKDPTAIRELRALASSGSVQGHLKKTDTVVILSGACAPEVQAAVEVFRPCLRRAVGGLSFTLISGGTRMGVSGLAGDAAARSDGRIRAFGYLPSRLPVGISADKKRYAGLFESKGTDFTPLDPFQGWTDLIVAGVDPARVKLVCFAGGRISRVECAAAIGLGAKVGIIDDDVVPADRRFNDPLWQEHPNMVRLPHDAMSLRAFLQLDMAPLTKTDMRRLEGAARMAHEDYLRSATPRDPSHQAWETLDESLKLSNYLQVTYWERVLREHGLGVRKITSPNKKIPLLEMVNAVGEDGILQLAETEHGRWNVERLSYGWRFAEEKDIAKKLSPYLIPWSKVPKRIQQYDIDAIHGLPRKLQEAGLELYKM